MSCRDGRLSELRYSSVDHIHTRETLLHGSGELRVGRKRQVVAGDTRSSQLEITSNEKGGAAQCEEAYRKLHHTHCFLRPRHQVVQKTM